ncbi:MAG: serine/threonine protein kinase, partial [Alkalispirochaetaceae bacterium]
GRCPRARAPFPRCAGAAHTGKMSDALTTFDLLTPEAALEAIEVAYGVPLDGRIMAYNSYINRVYGVRGESGKEYVAKFYRPGRWSWEAIIEEHTFVLEARGAEIPVVEPLGDREGESLCEVEVTSAEGERESFPFALFPKRGGRTFDAESDEAWFRLGSAVGRLHAVGRRQKADHRPWCHPESWTAPFVRELLAGGLVHPDMAAAFEELAAEMVELISPAFEGVDTQRLHGDCHRGNLLDRPGEGLLIIDFDDMMIGPQVQDLWLLLPGRAEECRRELNVLLEGYEEFTPFPRESLRLIEPLRFMRMIHFLAWRARQRKDRWFKREHPDWGTKQFWVTEMEDLAEQARAVRAALS